MIPFLLLLLACTGDKGSSGSSGGDRSFVLGYQNNVNGDIEPCG